MTKKELFEALKSVPDDVEVQVEVRKGVPLSDVTWDVEARFLEFDEVSISFDSKDEPQAAFLVVDHG